MSTTGAEIWASLPAMGTPAYEAKVLEHFRHGRCPDWLLKNPWPTVTTEGSSPSGAFRTLTYYCAPQFFALGTDSDPAIVPIQPATFQMVCDALGCVMPTRKMATDIYKAGSVKLPLADVKLPPTSIPVGKIGTLEAARAASSIVQTGLGGKVPSATNLVVGCKKDLVNAPGSTGAKVHLFGGQKPDGSFPVQGFSGDAHGSFYVDYSHGARLVLDVCFLDGKKSTLSTIAADPATAFLVSDQGPFDLRFPNASSKVKISTMPDMGSAGASIADAARPIVARGDGQPSSMTTGEAAMVWVSFLGGLASLFALIAGRPAR